MRKTRVFFNKAEGVVKTQEVFENESHFRSAFDVFNTMRECDQLCDTTVQVFGTTLKVRAHRVVLSAAIPYFRALFSTMPNEMNEQNVNVIKLVDIDIHSLKLLVDYAYTGRIGITEQNVKSLITAANRLQVSSVSEACYQFLTKRLNPSNCLSIHSFAVQHKFTELAKTAHKYSLENFADVVLTKDFLLLSFTEVLNIISSNELNARNEELVYNAVMTWIREDWEERERHLEELLPHVRPSLIDPTVLVPEVAKEPLIISKTVGKDLLSEAMAHRLCPKKSNDKIRGRTTQRTPIGLKSYIYVIGGEDPTRSVYPGFPYHNQYTPSSGQWTPFAPAHYIRSKAGVAHNGMAYGLGGYAGGYDSSVHHRNGEYYNPSSGQWTPIAPTTSTRTQTGALALNGMVYAIGCYDYTTGLSPSAEVYNPVTKQWKDIKNMITKRIHFGVAELNGLVYVSGGYNGTSYIKCVESYDPYLGNWSVMSANHIHGGYTRLLGLNGCLYAVGGCYNGNYSSALERMDPREGKWHSMPDMSVSRYACGFAALDDVLYVVGGYGANGYMSSGERFDTISHKWEPIPSMPSVRSGHQLVECEGQLYALGGQDGNQSLETVVSYEPSTQIWSSVPSMARKRHCLGAAVLQL